jgi:hypothetical protein
MLIMTAQKLQNVEIMGGGKQDPYVGMEIVPKFSKGEKVLPVE